jgi:hypothetical protein
LAPQVTVDIADQTFQYSDGLCKVTFTATDVAADTLTATTTPDALPNGFSLTPKGCAVVGLTRTCTWELASTQDIPGGLDLSVIFTVTDKDGGSGYAEASITVEPEDADVWIESDNVVAVKVDPPGGDSPAFSLTAYVKETVPDIGCNAAPGDINKAQVEMTLAAVGPGSSYTVTCDPVGEVVPSGGYGDVLEVSCTFDDIATNTYHVQASAVGDYYTGGPDEDVLVIYDPSLGFTTGGGWFYWPGTTDKTNFGYTMKYNKKMTKVQGSLLLIRHVAEDEIYRVKSNALYGLALGESSDPAFGWASFSGKCTYKDVGWELPIGNHTFLVYVEDHGEPGGQDGVWLEIFDKNLDLILAMSMDRPALDNTEALQGGNIVVPHGAGK